jgi:antitoxin MazE
MDLPQSNELRLAQIGNSRGVRLPKALIRKHGLENGLVLEDRGHELVITPRGGPKKLSWEATYQEMAVAGEACSDWDCSVADGLDTIPWDRPIGTTANLHKRAKTVRRK